ncbi:MAG: signal peptidase I [Paracholeplasma sp.]|jgi:signal peptidase I|nr:signal peptidase I [Paracholeplasma sp.]MDY3195537.1 signal peptidase I [Paracholeplasma sp.]HBT59944.1 signal peptidase I [Acholeplasmataceae bacterium]
MKLKNALEELKLNETEQESEAINVVSKTIDKKLRQLLVYLIFVSVLTLLFTVLGFGSFTDQKYKVLIIITSALLSLIVAYYLPSKEALVTKESTLSRFKRIDLIHFFLLSTYFVFILISFVVRTAVVEGTSMETTLFGGDKIIAYHMNYSPKRGDVVIVDMKEHNFEQIYYVKRLIGLPGDKIQFDRLNGKLYINDELKQDVPPEYRESLAQTLNGLSNDLIPKGSYFILGDNIQTSLDSRRIGFIKEEQLVGKVLLRFSPKFEVIS